MPIDFDLEALRKKHNIVNYLETGLYDPRQEVSCRKALTSGFKKVYSIEIRQDWVDIGQDVFDYFIHTNRLRLICDDSANLMKHLHKTNDFQEKTLFFLDAHVDNSDIQKFRKRCPVIEELHAISSLDRKDHVICVDDMRIIREMYPWGESSYQGINFEEEIKKIILSINPNYKFEYLDGHVKGDILYAYVE